MSETGRHTYPGLVMYVTHYFCVDPEGRGH